MHLQYIIIPPPQLKTQHHKNTKYKPFSTPSHSQNHFSSPPIIASPSPTNTTAHHHPYLKSYPASLNSTNQQPKKISHPYSTLRHALNQSLCRPGSWPGLASGQLPGPGPWPITKSLALAQTSAIYL